MMPDEFKKIVCEQTRKEMLERYEPPMQLFDVTDTIYRECQKQFENEVALVVGHRIEIEKLDAERLKKALEFDRNCHRELVEKIEQLEELIEEKDAHINVLEDSIERAFELPPTYFCDPDKNTECRKTACFKNGGPCQMTLKKSCAAYVDDKAPEPVNYKEVNKND